MAVVLDMNFLCNQMLDVDIMLELFSDYGVCIKDINSIADWQWNDEQKIELQKDVEKELNNNRIVIFQLKRLSMKDLGLYIEKVDNSYLYTLWVNTEGHPMMDCDMITSENRKFYEEIYQIVSKIDKMYKDILKVVGIGLETEFYYSENVIHTIQNSRNVIVWILNNSINDDNMKDSYKEKSNGINNESIRKNLMEIFEK